MNNSNTKEIIMPCRFAVIDRETKVVLSIGESRRNVVGLQYVCEFRRFRIFGRKLIQYVDYRTVKKHKCVVVYWAGVPLRKSWSKVMLPGKFIGIPGNTKGKNKTLRFKRLLKSVRKHFQKFLKREYKEILKRKKFLYKYCGNEEEFRDMKVLHILYEKAFINKYKALSEIIKPDKFTIKFNNPDLERLLK